MKFLLKYYRTIMIILSLMIISLGFVAASDKERRVVCVLIAFILGTLLYLTGSVREWNRNRLPACLIEAVLAVCMLVAALLMLPDLGRML